METAACLIYLLKKVDKKDALGFKDDLERNECIQWVVLPDLALSHYHRRWVEWQMGGLGKFPTCLLDAPHARLLRPHAGMLALSLGFLLSLSLLSLSLVPCILSLY
jgi:hypothetical protein